MTTQQTIAQLESYRAELRAELAAAPPWKLSVAWAADRLREIERATRRIAALVARN